MARPCEGETGTHDWQSSGATIKKRLLLILRAGNLPPRGGVNTKVQRRVVSLDQNVTATRN
ncbi:hypothetical protein M406DRAFT_55697, partial [Cryphonectria parasitica EP155]